MNFAIREAESHDADAVAELFDQYRQFYALAADLALSRRFIGERLAKHESVILVAASTASPALLGFCQLFPTFCSLEAAPIYALYDLFVLPAARKAGVGRALLQAAEQRAAADGRVRLDLTTARSNTTAQALYASQGWVRDEVFLAYNRRVVPALKP